MDKNVIQLKKLLKKKGTTSSEFRNLDMPIGTLIRFGVSYSRIAQAYFADEIKRAGVSVSEFHNKGISTKVLARAGYSARELLEGGYSVTNVAKCGVYNADQLRGADIDVQAMFSRQIPLFEVVRAGFSAADIVSGGYALKSLAREHSDSFSREEFEGLGANPYLVEKYLNKFKTTTEEKVLREKGLVEIVDGELINALFENPTLLSLIARGLEITKERGYETQFSIWKRFGESRLLFDPSIVIGEEKSVSFRIGLKRAKEKFKAERGLSGTIYRTNKEFIEWAKSNNELWEEDVDIDPTISLEFIASENRGSFYKIGDFHSHPTKNVNPSVADLNSLNFEMWLTFLRTGMLIKPISMIAGNVGNSNEPAPFFIFQQNVSGLIDTDHPIDRSRLTSIRGAFPKQEIVDEEALIRNIFREVRQSVCFGSYKVARADFDRQTHTLSNLISGGDNSSLQDLRDFAFKSELANPELLGKRRMDKFDLHWAIKQGDYD